MDVVYDTTSVAPTGGRTGGGGGWWWSSLSYTLLRLKPPMEPRLDLASRWSRALRAVARSSCRLARRIFASAQMLGEVDGTSTPRESASSIATPR